MLEGKILLYTSNDEEISSGDVVSFRGSLKVFDGATASLNKLLSDGQYPDIKYGIKQAYKNIGFNGKIY